MTTGAEPVSIVTDGYFDAVSVAVAALTTESAASLLSVDPLVTKCRSNNDAIEIAYLALLPRVRQCMTIPAVCGRVEAPSLDGNRLRLSLTP